MPFDHTSTPRPLQVKTSDEPDLVPYVPGEAAEAFVSGVGRRLSLSQFVEPCVCALEQDFGFKLGARTRKAVFSRALLQLARDVASKFASPDEAADDYLKSAMFASLVRESSVALIGQAIQANHRDDIVHAPYLFFSARQKFHQRARRAPFADPSERVPDALRTLLYGVAPAQHGDVYADPRYQAALGIVMLDAVGEVPRIHTMGQALRYAERLLDVFDSAIEESLTPTSVLSPANISLGEHAVAQVFDRRGLGFESALPVDIEWDVQTSQILDADTQWVGLAAISEESRRRAHAQRVVQQVFRRFSPRLQQVCLQVLGLGRRNAAAAKLLKISPGTIGGYLTQIRQRIRAELNEQALTDSTPVDFDERDTLSELLPAEAASRIVDLLFRGSLGGTTAA